MPTLTKEKSSLRKPPSVRLDMRLAAETKALLERAAALKGQSLTDYAISNLVEAALQTIERQERIVLSDRGRAQFLAALDRPARLLPNLVKAAKKYGQTSKRTSRAKR